MAGVQNVVEAVKTRWRQVRRYSGRPGYLGFGLLGIGILVSGMRHDHGMGLLLIIAIVAFFAEYIRLVRGGL